MNDMNSVSLVHLFVFKFKKKKIPPNVAFFLGTVFFSVHGCY